MNFTSEQIIKAFDKKGYKFSDKGIDIIGIRSTIVKFNYFTDLVGIILNKSELKLWEATTRPGKWFMEHPMNPGGCFIMVPGQYVDAYDFGLHYTQDALIQVGLLKGYRDDNCNDTFDLDPEKMFVGNYFRVDIHHKENDSETIDMGSAGCQVFKHTLNHKEFMKICHQYKGKFTYTLLEESDFI